MSDRASLTRGTRLGYDSDSERFVVVSEEQP